MLLALLLATTLGSRIAERAHDAAGLHSVHQLARGVNDDCSGFARLIYQREGVDLAKLPAKPGENGVSNIRRLAAARRALRKVPRPGDLVFFHDTTARHGYTHVGIVDSVEYPRVTFVHRAGRGIVRSRLDLLHPRRRETNDFIKRGPRPRLAGELVAGFAEPDALR
jgi:cell wall-associated NlpC family hydrolase